jgi:hypothetical protein
MCVFFLARRETHKLPALIILQVVVLTQSSLEEQLEISAITHEHDIALIVDDSRGLFG